MCSKFTNYLVECNIKSIEDVEHLDENSPYYEDLRELVYSPRLTIPNHIQELKAKEQTAKLEAQSRPKSAPKIGSTVATLAVLKARKKLLQEMEYVFCKMLNHRKASRACATQRR